MEDIMINKLSLSSYHFEEKFVAIEDKINELIEVVKQHKIDFLTWSGLDRDELNELLGEEASKGEGEKFVEHYKNYCKKHDIPPNKTYCIDIKKEFSNPPQQEESRGECENCAVNKPGGVIAATSDLKHCAVCGRDLFPDDNFPEPQLKEESPKEEMVLLALLSDITMGRLSSSDARKKILEMFVSKVRIKRGLNKWLDDGSVIKSSIFEYLGL